jgi:hypothetical protein
MLSSFFKWLSAHEDISILSSSIPPFRYAFIPSYTWAGHTFTLVQELAHEEDQRGIYIFPKVLSYADLEHLDLDWFGHLDEGDTNHVLYFWEKNGVFAYGNLDGTSMWANHPFFHMQWTT